MRGTARYAPADRTLVVLGAVALSVALLAFVVQEVSLPYVAGAYTARLNEKQYPDHCRYAMVVAFVPKHPSRATWEWGTGGAIAPVFAGARGFGPSVSAVVGLTVADHQCLPVPGARYWPLGRGISYVVE